MVMVLLPPLLVVLAPMTMLLLSVAVSAAAR
jgi:hypothetical protein